MASELVYLRDLDGTGSMHVCASGDDGAIAYAPADTRPAPEYAGLVERLGDAELQRLLKDLTPYREKTIGSLRIDMGEVRKICRAVEVCDEAATALTALAERNKVLEAEVERLREALLDCAAPMRILRRHAEEQGRELNGMAYTVANDVHFVKEHARKALEAQP